MRGDALHVFMPPLTELPVYLELVHAIEEIVMEMSAPEGEKLKAAHTIRLWADVLETLFSEFCVGK